jgi:hypothetical protein
MTHALSAHFKFCSQTDIVRVYKISNRIYRVAIPVAAIAVITLIAFTILMLLNDHHVIQLGNDFDTFARNFLYVPTAIMATIAIIIALDKAVVKCIIERYFKEKFVSGM